MCSFVSQHIFIQNNKLQKCWFQQQQLRPLGLCYVIIPGVHNLANMLILLSYSFNLISVLNIPYRRYNAC